MSITPVIKGARLVAVLLKMGFKVIRQKGSHAQLMHPNAPGRVLTIPISNKTLRKGTLIAVLKQAGISLQQFLDVLK